ncbi:MAG: NAD(+)/NADH kinase [Solirubrobacteraceae bacterium]
MVPRCVLVERATDYQALVGRHGTREQARFFLQRRGQTLEEVERRDAEQRRQHADVLGAIPSDWRRASVQRADLDRFLFEPDDVIVVLGQDGLVANVAKYLAGQPVIGLNPKPERYPGILVPHPPEAAGDLMRDAARGVAHVQRRTMAEATLEDGQRLLALNVIFGGHASHQSARYEIALGDASEHQSSSGVVVATGTGATGWAASLHRERHSTLNLPDPEQAELAFFVREPWPSAATGTAITEGLLAGDTKLRIRCENGADGVLFGDGIESDRVALDWGELVTVAPARQSLTLLA